MAQQMDSKEDLFIEGCRSFEKATQAAVKVSGSRLGIEHTGRQNRILTAFAKMISHAMTIQLIYNHARGLDDNYGFLDHFSIATLTRSVIDSAIMALYLSEPSLSKVEWDLRRQVLFLHDLTNRKRFLTAAYKSQNNTESEKDKREYKEAKTRIVNQILKCCTELTMSEERTLELSKGQLVFQNGVRGAIREAGLDVVQFDFLYTYLSNHVHSHPVSLMRAKQHNISFERPSDFQFGMCGLCLESGAQYLDAATARVEAFTGHFDRDPNGHID